MHGPELMPEKLTVIMATNLLLKIPIIEIMAVENALLVIVTEKDNVGELITGNKCEPKLIEYG